MTRPQYHYPKEHDDVGAGTKFFLSNPPTDVFFSRSGRWAPRPDRIPWLGATVAKPTPQTYDVVVAGARCAGAPTAMLLARAGLRVLVVDRAVFPSDTISGHMIKPAGVACLACSTRLPRISGAHDRASARVAALNAELAWTSRSTNWQPHGPRWRKQRERGPATSAHRHPRGRRCRNFGSASCAPAQVGCRVVPP